MYALYLTFSPMSGDTTVGKVLYLYAAEVGLILVSPAVSGGTTEHRASSMPWAQLDFIPNQKKEKTKLEKQNKAKKPLIWNLYIFVIETRPHKLL